MASKTHLQERIDKWNIKIDGYKEKIAKYEARIPKILATFSKSVGEKVTLDNYENFSRVDFENYCRVGNALDGIETNERNIRWAEREIKDIQYKLDAIISKEKEFDYDLESILQNKLSDFKNQWIDKMLDYYKNVWANIRKKYPTVKARYDELSEERRTLSYREYYKWKALDAQIAECRKTINHESLRFDSASEYANSKYDEIIDYYNQSIKRLVTKCYKFNIDRSNISVSYPEVTAAGMECFITDDTGKRIWARMIWAAEYSDYMIPHVRYIVTEKRK